MRLGQDIETLLVDNTGKHISVIGLINADKWNPMQIPDMPAGFTLQEDNVALEYGMPPASSLEEWDNSNLAVMEKSKDFIKGLSFSKLSCVVYDKDQMRHPAAHTFGCEPDFNAWGDCSLDENGEPRNTNPKPKPSHPFMRSAGGHIHVETVEDPTAVIRSMDLFLGVPSVLMDNGELRKEMYGKAGAHRVKSYGVEYRTLSNFWAFTPELRQWVWRNTERALANIGAADYFEDEILSAINKNDKDMAQWLVDHLNLELA